MVFTVLGAVAELERSLIAERVRAGLRNAKAKGKTLGRPKIVGDAARIQGLRARGFGWKRVAKELGLGVGTVLRIAHEAAGRDLAGSKKVAAASGATRAASAAA
jgi:DNA invertase Pin-like site-specific DNA recombinase